MSRADHILDLIDAGLQSSYEVGCSTDRRPGRCARCLHHEPVEDGDLCDGCRAFLLGDSDTDPSVVQPHRASIGVEVMVNAGAAVRAFASIGASAAAFDPGPCPQCGGTDYRINWVDTGDGYYVSYIPGTVTCLNPDCPPQGRLCSRWD